MSFLVILTVLNYKIATLLFALSCLGIYLGFKSKKDFFKHLFYNGSAIILALALFEGYLTKEDLKQSEFHLYEELVEDQYGRDHSEVDIRLGYGPVEKGEFRAHKKLRHTAEMVYDANYTFKNGRRYTPSSDNSVEDCIHFFGCSYTFGHGLDDTATLPHYLGLLTSQPFQVINHGFDGYGAHQVMQQVEQLVREKGLGNGRKIAIYPHLLGHVSRAAGYASWDRFGPHYEVENGELRNLGPFENRASLWVKYFDPYLLKSRIYRRFFKQYFKKITDPDIERSLAIILNCNRLLSENGFEFEVFIYDIQHHILSDFGSLARYEKAIEILREAGVQLHFLSDVIGDYDENMDKYTISIHDRHPNALSNKLVGTYLSSLYNQEGISFSDH